MASEPVCKKMKVGECDCKRTKVVLIGAAGFDYHCFNRVFRANKCYEVCAMTVAVEQNLGTTTEALRPYPAKLAGPLYPNGIPSIFESELAAYVKANKIDVVVMAYSDLSYESMMHKGSIALAAGANFWAISPHNTMIKSTKPVVGVCAVRTGCGKSQTSTKVVEILKSMGKKVVAVREPMPYGDLVAQSCMRFATWADLDKHKCTIEEREEYEQYVEKGLVIYSGVDYEMILREAEKEADIIVWDGGNNEVPFFVCDTLFVVADPLRPGHELSFYPGEVNARIADYFIINKENSATAADIATVEKNLRAINTTAKVIHADSIVSVDDEALVKGKKVVVIEDGPTLTHGNMAYGAGIVAAKQLGCTVVDPKPYLKGSLKTTFEEFKQLDTVVPAMGYTAGQIADLQDTINAIPCDAVLSGTPFDLLKQIKLKKPATRVRYAVVERSGSEKIADILKKYA